jgi:hypothetical protein
MQSLFQSSGLHRRWSTRTGSEGRSAHHQRDRPSVPRGLSMAGAPRGIWGRTRPSSIGTSAGAGAVCGGAVRGSRPMRRSSRANDDRQFRGSGRIARRAGPKMGGGRSCGGRTTKIHAHVDDEGRPARLPFDRLKHRPTSRAQRLCLPRLQTFLPSSTPRTTISISIPPSEPPATWTAREGGAGHSIKLPAHAEQERPDVAAARAAWRETRAPSIRAGWCSSTRPGPRST